MFPGATMSAKVTTTAEETSSSSSSSQTGKKSTTTTFQDPLVAIMMNAETVKLSGAMIAKLEYIKYDETRRGVFRTAWAKDLFITCVKRLANCSCSPDDCDCPSPSLADFDIDAWYYSVVGSKSTPTNYWQDPKLQSQDINTNWLIPMFAMEIKIPGFITLLYNTMEMEDSAHAQLATKSKTEACYDFLGTGSRNAALQLTSGSSKTVSSSEIGRNVVVTPRRPSYIRKLHQ